MTFTEAASAMHRVANAIERVAPERGDIESGHPKPMLEGDVAVGGALILCYLRDLFTTGERETYGRADVLVLLETIARDGKLFPCGAARTIWECE
jgi:hypothetical protein